MVESMIRGNKFFSVTMDTVNVDSLFDVVKVEWRRVGTRYAAFMVIK